MSNISLVFNKDDSVLTSSEIIAKSLDREHKDVMSLAHNYETELNQFGHASFETNHVKRGFGSQLQEKEIAYFNEQQATFLISLMRNSPKVVKFKVALVKAFYEMKEKLAQKTIICTQAQLDKIKQDSFVQGFEEGKAYTNERTARINVANLEKALTSLQFFKDRKTACRHAYRAVKDAVGALNEVAQTLDICATGYSGYLSIGTEEVDNLIKHIKQHYAVELKK